MRNGSMLGVPVPAALRRNLFSVGVILGEEAGRLRGDGEDTAERESDLEGDLDLSRLDLAGVDLGSVLPRMTLVWSVSLPLLYLGR